MRPRNDIHQSWLKEALGRLKNGKTNNDLKRLDINHPSAVTQGGTAVALMH
jgi:hypothetical protein